MYIYAKRQTLGRSSSFHFISNAGNKIIAMVSAPQALNEEAWDSCEGAESFESFPSFRLLTSSLHYIISLSVFMVQIVGLFPPGLRTTGFQQGLSPYLIGQWFNSDYSSLDVFF